MSAVTLSQITDMTIAEILRKEICLPSDYLKIFNEFLGNEKISLDDLTKEQISLDLEKSQVMLSATRNIINDAIEVAAETKTPAEFKQEMQVLVDKLQQLSDELNADALTKSKNRKWFFDEFVKEGRVPQKCSIAFIDLNDFKKINDTYGHDAGDATLRFFVKFMNSNLSNAGEVVRYAGDEFLIIYNGDDLEVRLQLLRKLIAKKRLVMKKQGVGFTVDFSYGVVGASQGDDIQEVLKEADEKMYLFKKNVKDKKNIS